MNSLQRTLYEAQSAVQRGEFVNDEYHQEGSVDDHFNPTLTFNNRLPMGNSAPFPMQEVPVHDNFGYTEPMYGNDAIFSMESLPQQTLPMQEPIPESFGCYVTSPPELDSVIDNRMTTFPSQLLAGVQDNSELTPRPFQTQAFSPAEVDAGSQSPPDPLESRFKSPPPPADIAARRAKRRPAAIGTSAIRDKSSTGPKTTSIPRPLGSPSIHAMRRVSSVNGSLNVIAGRVQKPGSYLPQRSPLQRHFSEGGMSFLEQNAQNIQHPPMPMLSASWLNKPFAPPTPNSPREIMLLQQHAKMEQEGNTSQETQQEEQKANSASPSNSEQSYVFDRHVPGCFTTTALNTTMASPPETPGHALALHWGYEVPDDALLTPGFGPFPNEGLAMPQPQYVSPLTSSQPPTPAFGQFTGFPYVHASPVFDLPSDSSEVDFNNHYFGGGGSSSVSSYPTVSSTHSSPEVAKNEKMYTFSHTTQKDFQ
jgi:hypothetical protein